MSNYFQRRSQALGLSDIFRIARHFVCSSDFTSKVLAQLPVIGPHGGGDEVIEGLLLLRGVKRLGWSFLLPSDRALDETQPEIQRQRKIENRLAQAVKEGRLKSLDVVVVEKFKDAEGRDCEWKDIYRHYCQPGHEKDLEVVASYNQQRFNFKEPDIQLEKSFGDYLGYRKRDQIFFDAINGYGAFVPRPIMRAIYKFNEHVTQPALLRQLLKTPKPS